jgi:hypothetical protein
VKAPLPRPLAWHLHPDDVAQWAAEGKYCEHRGCQNPQSINTWRYFWSKSAGRVLLAEHQVCDQHGQEFAARHHIEIQPPPDGPEPSFRSRRAGNTEGTG